MQKTKRSRTPAECRCSLRIKLAGDGCSVCNPELAKELRTVGSGRSFQQQPTNMNPTIQILNEAKHEITSLRRQNEILRAKVEVMDLFACVLHTQPAMREQGMTVDIAWQLEKEAARLEEADKPQPAQ